MSAKQTIHNTSKKHPETFNGQKSIDEMYTSLLKELGNPIYSPQHSLIQFSLSGYRPHFSGYETVYMSAIRAGGPERLFRHAASFNMH